VPTIFTPGLSSRGEMCKTSLVFVYPNAAPSFGFVSQMVLAGRHLATVTLYNYDFPRTPWQHGLVNAKV